MDEVERALAERRNLKVAPVAKKAGITAGHLYGVLKEDPEGTVRVGRALRITPRRVRRILGIAEEQPEAVA